MMWMERSKGSLPAGSLALLVLLGGVALASAQTPKAERPSYAVGDRWIRSDGAYDLIRIENGRYVFAADGGREVHLTRDLGIARVVRAGQTLLELEPAPAPTWPLAVGQWGVGWLTLKSSDPQYGQSLVRATWKVDAYEDVRVPAGVFKAFRIVQVLEPHFLAASPQSRRLEVTLWYAPSIQQLVRADGGDLSGLAFKAVALERPGPAPLAVSLKDPKDQVRTATERIPLTGKVTGGAGALRIAVTLNGAEIARQQTPGGTRREVPLNVPLKLAPGKNTLIVTATDASGTTHQEARVLFYDPPAPAVAAAPSPPPAPARPTPPPPVAPGPAVTPPAPAVGPPPAPPPPTARVPAPARPSVQATPPAPPAAPATPASEPAPQERRPRPEPPRRRRRSPRRRPRPSSGSRSRPRRTRPECTRRP